MTKWGWLKPFRSHIYSQVLLSCCNLAQSPTLNSGILDVRQKINVGPGKFSRKNKYRALNNRGHGKLAKI